MSFPDAIRSVLSQYATFSSRARRSEYWWFVLFAVIVTVATAIVDEALDTGAAITLIASLALLLPGIAVAVRRLHDTGRSGWWYLIGFVPFGFIVLLVFMVLDSEHGPNRFGPSPKYAQPGYESAPA